MKTYPIADHIPEPELLAITPDGAARWLERHGWGSWVVNAEVEPQECLERLADLVGELARHHGRGPRAIIAEMQADSRIMAALRASRGTAV